MDIQKQMIAEVNREWRDNIPYTQYATLSDVKYGYNFGCLLSIGDFQEQQKKVVIGIANLASNNYEVSSIAPSGNVELIERICKIIKKLFPEQTYDGYRDMIFDMLDECIVPALEKYEKGLPPGYQLLDARSEEYNDDGGATRVSYFVSTTDIKFNFKMVPLIEDYLRKEEAS